MAENKKHYIYHITHVRNLPSIIHSDGLLAKSCLDKEYTDIAYQSVQQMRSLKQVPIQPYGTVHDYVPFYFGKRPAMLLPLSNGQVEGYAEGQKPIIYLVSSTEWTQSASTSFVFTDGHAAIAISSFYNDLAHIEKVDFDTANAKYWSETEDDPDRKRRKQAEFLVKDKFPWVGVHGIVTINQKMKTYVERVYKSTNCPHRPRIEIAPTWYY